MAKMVVTNTNAPHFSLVWSSSSSSVNAIRTFGNEALVDSVRKADLSYFRQIFLVFHIRSHCNAKKTQNKKLRQREILSGMFSLISLKLLLGGSVAFYFSFSSCVGDDHFGHGSAKTSKKFIIRLIIIINAS